MLNTVNKTRLVDNVSNHKKYGDNAGGDNDEQEEGFQEEETRR